MAAKPQVIVVNKVDLPEVQERLPELMKELRRPAKHVFYGWRLPFQALWPYAGLRRLSRHPVQHGRADAEGVPVAQSAGAQGDEPAFSIV